MHRESDGERVLGKMQIELGFGFHHGEKSAEAIAPEKLVEDGRVPPPLEFTATEISLLEFPGGQTPHYGTKCRCCTVGWPFVRFRSTLKLAAVNLDRGCPPAVCVLKQQSDQKES